MPTVSQIVAELTQAGLAEEAGLQVSEGGRRPVSIIARPDGVLAGGIEVSQHHLCMSVVNLEGECKAFSRVKFPSESCVFGEPERVAAAYRAFLEENGMADTELAGIGIALPGIIEPGGERLLYSHVLGIVKPRGLKALRNAFTERVYFLNDATSACMAECFTADVPDSFNFISLGNSVGGAMVIGGEIVEGDNCRCGEAGHVLIHPKGRKCYCGQSGHYDPYGSARILSDRTDGSLEEFFEELERGNEELGEVFDEYLGDLALITYNLHVFTDLPVLIGGYVGAYLGPWLPELKKKASELELFTDNGNYISAGHFHYEAASVGAASFFLEEVINGL